MFASWHWQRFILITSTKYIIYKICHKQIHDLCYCSFCTFQWPAIEYDGLRMTMDTGRDITPLTSFTHLYVFFSPIIYISFYLSVCQSVCLSLCLPVSLPVSLPACLSVCLSVSLSVCLSNFLPIQIRKTWDIGCLAVCLSVCVSGCLPFPKKVIWPGFSPRYHTLVWLSSCHFTDVSILPLGSIKSHRDILKASTSLCRKLYPPLAM